MQKLDFWEIQRFNKRKTILIFVFLFFILWLLGFTLDHYYFGLNFPLFELIALGFASLESLTAFFLGDKIILASVGARPADITSFKEKQLINVVEELSLAAGMKRPNVYVIPRRRDLNAFATGRNEETASVAVTEGLLEAMSREELQGVIGHELAHIRNRDILTMTVATIIFGAVIILSRIFLRGGFWFDDDERGKKSGVLLIIALILAILAPIMGQLLVLAVSRSREYMADAGSVEFTRNPEGLISALEKIAQMYAQNPLPKRLIKKTEPLSHLFIYSPLSKRMREEGSFWAEMWSTHPPLEKRVARLKSMAGVSPQIKVESHGD